MSHVLFIFNIGSSLVSLVLVDLACPFIFLTEPLDNGYGFPSVGNHAVFILFCISVIHSQIR
jgi:hypothetical protein